MILFPTLEEALELHRVLVKRFGGNEGVRDMGLLQSALYRPQTGYYEDIIQMAAALMESLMINHPFIDGNKRMAFFLSDIFLRLNGWKILVSPKNGHQFIVQVIMTQDKDRFASLVKWLTTHVVKR